MAGESATLLASIGIAAQVIRTPGHSDDSISLVTDSGDACIGDLYPLEQVMPDDSVTLDSWTRIRAAGGRRILPSHAPAFELAP